MIDTKRVTNRRKLRFENFEEVVADAIALAEAEQAGTLRATGNWELGQALGHIAYWARVPFEGYPELPKMPWLVAKILRFLKTRFLNNGLPAGARIPSLPEGTLGTERMPIDQGLRELGEALPRMAEQTPTLTNPIFGELTHDEWIKLNLRHSELHLSFFHAE